MTASRSGPGAYNTFSIPRPAASCVWAEDAGHARIRRLAKPSGERPAMSHEVDLRAYGLSVPETLVNAPVAQLYEYGVTFDGAAITSSGALASSSGEKTGR